MYVYITFGGHTSSPPDYIAVQYDLSVVFVGQQIISEVGGVHRARPHYTTLDLLFSIYAKT